MQKPSYTTNSGWTPGTCQQSPRKDEKGIVCSHHSQKKSSSDCCVYCVSYQLVVSLSCAIAGEIIASLTGQRHDHFISLNRTELFFSEMYHLLYSLLLLLLLFISLSFEDTQMHSCPKNKLGAN